MHVQHMEQEWMKPVEEMDAMVAAEEAAGKAEQEEKGSRRWQPHKAVPCYSIRHKLDILNEWKGAPNKTAWLRNIAPSHRLGVARRRKRKRRCS